MDWWTQLVNSIADTFYPDRVAARAAEKKAEDEKAVAKAVKEGEVKLKKFSEQSTIIKEKPKPILKLNVEPAKPKRARTTKGHYRRDDKATANTNEAWVGGKKPKSKKKKK
tara:strand:- start:14 stop:346 length:333 start_codon:yes stop_codon:yes gene_type:complete